MYSDEIICRKLTRIADALEDIRSTLSNQASSATPAREFPAKEMENGKQLMTSEEAAKYLGINKHTLSVWRSTRRYNVPVIKVGSAIRYKRTDLDLWLATRRPD